MSDTSIGRKTIIIDGNDFLLGHTTGNNLSDGGFSDESYGINTEVEPGVLSFIGSTTTPTTSPVGHLEASVINDTTATVDNFFLGRDDATGDGTYYYWNGTNLTLKKTDSTNNYSAGKNNIITYRNEIYGTSNEKIVQWTADNATFDVSFQAFNDTSAPHPAIVYEDNAFYADGNELWRQTTASTVPTVILTLVEGTVITAMGIDPGSGKLLIATSSSLNVSDTLPTTNKILYYDGFSNKPTRAIIVDDMVTAFYSVGSTMFVAYGQNLGYWNGSGVRFLRKLNVQFSSGSESLVYKNRITSIGSTLYVVEGRFILAYGDIIASGVGGTSFRYIYRSPVNDISLITNLGQNKLGIGTFTDESFLTLDLDTLGVNGVFKSLRYTFSKNITFNQVTIEYFTGMASDGTDVGQMDVIYEGATASSLPVVNTVSGKKIGTVTYPTINTRTIQLSYAPVDSTQIRRITIYYNDHA